MSDPDHTLDLVPSPSRGGGRGGGRKKSAARQNSNRRRRSAGAAGLIDESGERIDELASPARCREAPRVETRLQSSPAGDSRGQREACTAERARLPEASLPPKPPTPPSMQPLQPLSRAPSQRSQPSVIDLIDSLSDDERHLNEQRRNSFGAFV